MNKLTLSKIFMLLIIITMFAMPVMAQAASLCFPTPPNSTLAFTAPATNMDGSPLTDLAGFKVYFGTSSATYGTPKDVAMDGATGPGTNGAVSLNTLSLLDGKTYFFAMTAYDTQGYESPLSNEISCTYDATQPKAPTSPSVK